MRRPSTGNTTEWQMGLRAFREGRVREAADRLKTAAEDEDRTVMQVVRFQTLAYLGAALYALGHPSEAVDIFEDAVRLSPTESTPPDLNINLANAYLAVGRREEARMALQLALEDAPGHVEARMMLERLENAPTDEPIAGAVLGESPEGVKNYLRTLSFSRVASNGFDPSQVRQALSQIERYINYLISQITERDQTIGQQEGELQRLHKIEDSWVEQFVESEHAHDPVNMQRLQGKLDSGDDQPGQAALTPLERLFQKKI